MPADFAALTQALNDLQRFVGHPTPGRKGAGIQVGLTDGRVLPLAIPTVAIRKALARYDVVYVRAGTGKNARAELRIRPVVQGAVLLIALVFVLVNLAIDVLNAVLDPRVRTV